MNKFEHVQGVVGPCTVRSDMFEHVGGGGSQLKKFEHIWGWGQTLYRGGPKPGLCTEGGGQYKEFAYFSIPWTEWQTDMETIPFPNFVGGQ